MAGGAIMQIKLSRVGEVVGNPTVPQSLRACLPFPHNSSTLRPSLGVCYRQ